MGTFLCSVVALATLVQAPSDSLAALRERVARDSLDGAGWLLVGRGYLQEAEEAHGRAHRAEGDSAWARAALDTAEAALARAVALAGPAGPSAAGDSARVLRVGVWAARSRLTWEEGGIAAALDAWGPLPTDLRVPAVLEELGENLLRACPPGGVLLTAGEADSDAAWYMRFARGLRPDLLVLPLAAWRSDAPLRARLARDLKLARRSANDGWLAELARRRPVCDIKRVLVANRGEIALRIIRACHEEGMEAVAVYSEVDRLSPHVRAADAAVALGPAPAAESYLDATKLLAAARDSGCQAIHPGYGFLSERAPFAEAVTEAGLAFVGPSAAAIRAMGDKTEARRRMQAAGVPIVPGTTRPLADHAQARPEAARLGYPVLLKAVAGGGGRGMRLVHSEAELEGAFEAAQSEAQKAFGAGEVYLEKYLERPRHIEIQVLGDSFGRVVALGERECSIQRRHQKLIEEAPSLAVTPALRRRLSDAAAAAAGAVGYVSAGTIEFLLAASGEFYFLEMNTRLQV